MAKFRTLALILLIVLCDAAKRRRRGHYSNKMRKTPAIATSIKQPKLPPYNEKSAKEMPLKIQSIGQLQPLPLGQQHILLVDNPQPHTPLQNDPQTMRVPVNSDNGNEKVVAGLFQIPWGSTVNEGGVNNAKKSGTFSNLGMVNVGSGENKRQNSFAPSNDNHNINVTSDEDLNLRLVEAWTKHKQAKKEFQELVGFSEQRWDLFWYKSDPLKFDLRLDVWRQSMLMYEDKIGALKDDFRHTYNFTDDAWNTYWKENSDDLKDQHDIDKLADGWILQEEVLMVKKKYKTLYTFTDETWNGIWGGLTDRNGINAYTVKWDKLMKSTQNEASISTPDKSQACTWSYPNIAKLSDTLGLIESVQNILGQNAKKIICNTGIPLIGKLRYALEYDYNLRQSEGSNQSERSIIVEQSGSREDNNVGYRLDNIDEIREMKQLVDEIISVMCEGK